MAQLRPASIRASIYRANLAEWEIRHGKAQRCRHPLFTTARARGIGGYEAGKAVASSGHNQLFALMAVVFPTNPTVKP
jgi:hypothetical protein